MSILLPFTLHEHLIVLDARINGTPARLVLDSGSGMCALDAEWARPLALKAASTAANATGADTVAIELATMDSLTLADTVELRDEPAALVPLGDVASRFGQPMHGTIGYGLFKRYVVEIDYASSVIRLHDPATFVYEGAGERLAIDFPKRVPIVQAEVVANGHVMPARLVLDLGTAGYDLSFTKPFADGHAEALMGGKHLERSVIGAGVGGTIHGFVTTLDEIRLGSLRVPSPRVAIPAEARGFFALARVVGTLGASLLSRTHVILDYPHNEVIIEPLMSSTLRSGL